MAILVIARIAIGTAVGGLDIVIVPHQEQRPTCKGHAKKHAILAEAEKTQSRHNN